MRPKCSTSLVTISSSGPRSSPARTMLQPSVVDRVSATCVGSTDEQRRELRAHARRASRAPVRSTARRHGPARCRRAARRRSPRRSTARAARSCPRSGTRSGRGRGTAARTSSKDGGNGRASVGTPMRVLLADPPAFTPQYDHALASALARAGAEVELVTSPFRFGEPPEPDGYRRSELFYPVSSRVFRRSRLRIPVKLLEHPVGLARLRRRRGRRRPPPVARRARARRPDPAPPCAARLHRARPAPAAHRGETRPLAPALRPFRADRRPQRARPRPAGRARRARTGSGSSRTRCSRAIRRDRDDGRTLLALGIIRAYKGIGDAIEAAKGIDGARLLVAGDPLESVDAYRAAAGDKAEWRLGYLSDDGDRPRARRATVALFPYRPEIDQSGALLRALGAGVPGRRLRRRRPRRAGAALRRRPGRARRATSDALTEARASCSTTSRRSSEARAGAERARSELTWDAAAAGPPRALPGAPVTLRGRDPAPARPLRGASTRT